MKGLLITSLVMVVAFYFGAVYACTRVETNVVEFDVGWCNDPVTVTLSAADAYGYCSNFDCRSSHETHKLDNITIGMLQ